MLRYPPLQPLRRPEGGRRCGSTGGNVPDEPIAFDNDDALERLAGLLEGRAAEVLEANALDLADERAAGLSPALRDRLTVTEARIGAPALRECMARRLFAWSGAGGYCGPGLTAARPIAWPPTMPAGPTARASHEMTLICSRGCAARPASSQRISNARAWRASPARMAAASST